MNFNIYVFNPKVEKFYLEAIKEYKKRLSRYCKVNLHHLKSEEYLLKKKPDKSYKIILSSKGTSLSSEQLALKIEAFGLNGKSDISIIISDNFNLPHDYVLALSTMDMNLGLQTTIMLEQIYRSYRILNNQPYHK